MRYPNIRDDSLPEYIGVSHRMGLGNIVVIASKVNNKSFRLQSHLQYYEHFTDSPCNRKVLPVNRVVCAFCDGANVRQSSCSGKMTGARLDTSTRVLDTNLPREVVIALSSLAAVVK